jgi:hypothetical protein
VEPFSQFISTLSFDDIIHLKHAYYSLKLFHLTPCLAVSVYIFIVGVGSADYSPIDKQENNENEFRTQFCSPGWGFSREHFQQISATALGEDDSQSWMISLLHKRHNFIFRKAHFKIETRMLTAHFSLFSQRRREILISICNL